MKNSPLYSIFMKLRENRKNAHNLKNDHNKPFKM